MSQADSNTIHPELARMAAILNARSWPDVFDGIPPSHPRNAGDGGGGGGEGGDGGDPGAAAGADGGDGAGDGGAPAAGADGKFDAEYVAKLRREAASHRKDARDAQAKLKKLEEQGLSDAEKLQKAADEGKELSARGIEALQRANLITALAEEGLAGGRAKAAARLLDVEYDDDHEPKDLAKAIKAAATQYGEDIFSAGLARPRVPRGPGPAADAPGAAAMDNLIRGAAGRH